MCGWIGDLGQAGHLSLAQPTLTDIVVLFFKIAFDIKNNGGCPTHVLSQVALSPLPRF
jgi:hypothetical protein